MLLKQRTAQAAPTKAGAKANGNVSWFVQLFVRPSSQFPPFYRKFYWNSIFSTLDSGPPVWGHNNFN